MLTRHIVTLAVIVGCTVALSAQGFLRMYQDSPLTNPCPHSRPIALSSAVLPSSQLVVTYVCENGEGTVRLFINPDQIDRPPLLPACLGNAPFPGGICQDGGWLPPNSPLVRK